MATDSTDTTGPNAPDVLVSTVTALTASGAWVTWSGYRAADKKSGRPDYYICSLPLNNTSAASSYDLVQIGAQAYDASIELTVIALGAGGTAQLTAPGGAVTPLTEGVPVTVAGSSGAGGQGTVLSFTGNCCVLKVVRLATTPPSSTTLSATSEGTLGGDDDGGPPPPYPGDGTLR